MRVLLFSVTAGEGHNMTAKAIARTLESMGAETRIVDSYRTAGRLMYYTVAKGYLLASSCLKYGYGAVYRVIDRRKSGRYRSALIRFSGRSLAKKFARIIAEYEPSAVICTHPFAARILDIAKERYGVRAKTVGVVTDFTMHPYWEESLRLDRVIIPCEPMIDAARKKGFTDAQIRPLGIPVHPKFAASEDKETARSILGLDPALPTLFLMSGSMGHGNMAHTLSLLDRIPTPHQTIVVCGSNKKMRERIDAHAWKTRVLTLGFTEKIPLLMDAADLVVSKPGGLTTSEAFTRRLPLVIVDPIPGHEKNNARFLTKEGCAVAVGRKYPLARAVEELLSDEERLGKMQAEVERLRKPNAVLDLCREIFALAEED